MLLLKYGFADDGKSLKRNTEGSLICFIIIGNISFQAPKKPLFGFGQSCLISLCKSGRVYYGTNGYMWCSIW